jgi:uncharacterized membrane protein YraQ (UPF0718 family)
MLTDDEKKREAAIWWTVLTVSPFAIITTLLVCPALNREQRWQLAGIVLLLSWMAAIIIGKIVLAFYGKKP